nr:hypothetical protein [Tanacetum cinerariifolium]
MELMVFLMKKGVCDEFGLNVARLSKFLLSGKCVICLPNEEIFAGLARMGYEKPSTKLTFYMAFFSTQWKFFLHTILHSLSAKRTSWNEFSSAMASALICLSSGHKFNFSKYIFESLVRNVDSSSKFYMYPRFIQLIIQTNIADLSTHSTRYISPVLTQKVFANMQRVRKGFSGVETPLFKNMLAVRYIDEEEEAQVPAQGDKVQEPVAEEVANDVVPPTPTSPSPSSPVLDTCSTLVLRVEGLENANAAQQLEIVKLKAKGRNIVDMDQDEGIELVVDHEKDAEVEGRHADKQAEIYNIDLDHSSKVLSMQEDDTEVQEAVEVVTTAKLITEVVTAATTQVVAANPKEELHTDTPAETPTGKDKGKGILIEVPKPMKKKDQDKDDDVFVEATPLAEKVSVVDYQKSKECSWFGIGEKMEAADFCGVHVIILSTVQLFLLVERRYPLLRFTLEKLVNMARLQNEKESEMSLELLRFTRQQLQEYQQG